MAIKVRKFSAMPKNQARAAAARMQSKGELWKKAGKKHPQKGKRIAIMKADEKRSFDKAVDTLRRRTPGKKTMTYKAWKAQLKRKTAAKIKKSKAA